MADLRSSSDYYPFGMALPARGYQSAEYRYGYNGQEKDDEIYGSGNLNTAEHWQYDTRLGRRWNIDPVVKPWRSCYDAFNNNPIIYVDVKGDDDFYNEFGKFVFSTSSGKRMMLISQGDADVYSKNLALSAKSNVPKVDFEKVAYANLLNTKSVEIKDNTSERQLDKLWSASNPPKDGANSPGAAVEHAAFVVLNIQLDKSGNLKSASINLEEVFNSKNTYKRSYRDYDVELPSGDARSINSKGLIIGAFHTHPTAGKTIGGEPFTSNVKEQFIDLSHFTEKNEKSGKSQMFPEYTRDEKFYDKISPNSSNHLKPITEDNYRPVGSGFQIGTDALKTYGGKK